MKECEKEVDLIKLIIRREVLDQIGGIKKLDLIRDKNGRFK